PAHDPGLPLEPTDELRIGGERAVQGLHGDDPTELHPLGPVHHTHRAAGDEADELVAALEGEADPRVGRAGVHVGPGYHADRNPGLGRRRAGRPPAHPLVPPRRTGRPPTPRNCVTTSLPALDRSLAELAINT